MNRKEPLWSVVLPRSSEEAEAWFAFPLAFAAGDRVLLAGGPASLSAYAVEDGRALGSIAVEGDGRDGFVVDEASWLAWTPGPAPISYALPAAWRSAVGSAA